MKRFEKFHEETVRQECKEPIERVWDGQRCRTTYYIIKKGYKAQILIIIIQFLCSM
jgi:hypothetical protein